LSRLAEDPEHRAVLNGTAAALRVLQRRVRGTPFSEFEGVLKDREVIRRISAALGKTYCYSPSQVETYIACPFQFFSRHVLKLNSQEQNDELDEDYTQRGSQVHDILEAFESLVLDRGGTGRLNTDELMNCLRTAIDRVLETEARGVSELEMGLKEVQRRRVEQILAFYLAQRQEYENQPGLKSIPHLFEVGFGSADTPYPVLEIGGGECAVRLRGRIDRIDLIESQSGRLFRVIDYKTGSVPSLADVKRGEMLQLLIYAMAVERLMVPNDTVVPLGAGYWGLKKDGYREFTFPDWPKVKQDLEEHVLAVVDRMRQGVFAVESKKPGCESYCDFRSICRIRQVRLANKRTEEAYSTELDVQAQSARDKRHGKDTEPKTSASASDAEVISGEPAK
jgi:ATP-dependent helicase/DNAse subunit B